MKISEILGAPEFPRRDRSKAERNGMWKRNPTGSEDKREKLEEMRAIIIVLFPRKSVLFPPKFLPIFSILNHARKKNRHQNSPYRFAQVESSIGWIDFDSIESNGAVQMENDTS